MAGNTSRRLDEAERSGGLIYKEVGVNTGKFIAVDAEGNAIPDAPPRPANTDVALQPHGSTSQSVAAPIDSHALGLGIAQGLAAASKANAASEPVDDYPPPASPVTQAPAAASNTGSESAPETTGTSGEGAASRASQLPPA